jgi:hypothetical protein
VGVQQLEVDCIIHAKTLDVNFRGRHGQVNQILTIAIDKNLASAIGQPAFIHPNLL